MLLNWPFVTTYMNVENIKTFETQSKVVLRRRNTWFLVSKDFFFARFLKGKNFKNLTFFHLY